MKILVGARGSGKTTELIKASAAKDYYIVTIDHRMAAYTVDLAKKLGLTIPFPITFDEFLKHEWNGKRINGFLIDDAELLFLRMLNSMGEVPIQGMAISTDYDPWI